MSPLLTTECEDRAILKQNSQFSVNQSSQIVVSLFSHGRLHGELDKSVNFGNIDHHSPLCGLCGHSK